MNEESLLDEENAIEKEMVTEEHTDVEDTELAEKKLRRKVVFGRVVFAVVVLAFVATFVYNYSLSFDATVTHFLDDTPRIGNNIYGYIDVPEGFTVTGSFNPQNANYVGGEDGIPEGVQLKNEDGTMYIMISLVTADRKRDDYVGFGDGRYCHYKKKNYFKDSSDVFQSMIEDLISRNILETEKDGLAAMSTSVLVGGIWGAVSEWKGQISGEEYQYRTFILGNPENKGVFHCVTVAYTGDNEECVEYARTFSLSPNRP